MTKVLVLQGLTTFGERQNAPYAVPENNRASLGVQGLRIHLPMEEDAGLIPRQGTKIPQLLSHHATIRVHAPQHKSLQLRHDAADK